jgi:hypothetical protein
MMRTKSLRTRDIFSHQTILTQHPEEKLHSVENVALMSIKGPDQGMNLGIFRTEGRFLMNHEIATVISQHLMISDQLVYPLVFRNWHGGCRSANLEYLKVAPPPIQNSRISLA